jgi:hypothetical protein
MTYRAWVRACAVALVGAMVGCAASVPPPCFAQRDCTLRPVNGR